MTIQDRNPILRPMFLCAALFATTEVSAYTLDLGLAGEFNAFILGDMHAANSDVEGRLAVGGNLILDNYAIGMTLSNSQGSRDDLIVGGDLTLTNARIYNGNARSGGTAVIDQTVGFYDSDPNVPNGAYIPGNPIDFATVGQELIAKSSEWGTLATNGTLTSLDQWGNLKLTGYNSNLNVFSLTASEIASTSAFWIDVPDHAKALINISGADVAMSNFGFFRTVNGERVQVQDNGQDSFFTQAVMFNLFGATSLDMHAIGMAGSLLAPLANTTFYNGQVNGNLIVGSLNWLSGQYTGQVNHIPFVSAQIPLPVVGWMLLFPLMYIRRRSLPGGARK